MASWHTRNILNIGALIYNRLQKQDQILTYAGALSFTTLLATIPILATGFFFFKIFGAIDLFINYIQPYLHQNFTAEYGDKITEQLLNFESRIDAKALGVFGVAGFLLTGILTLSKIENTLNNIWGVPHERKLMKRVAIYWCLLTITPLLIGPALALNAEILHWLRSYNEVATKILEPQMLIAPFTLSALFFTSLYQFVPNTTVRFQDSIKAGIITALFFILSINVYTSFIIRSIAKQSLYDSLVIIPIFLVWLIMVWVVVLLGAELCCFLSLRHLGVPFFVPKSDRINLFIAFDIVDFLSQRNAKSRHGVNETDLLAHMRLPMAEMFEHLNFLVNEGWVIKSSNDSALKATNYVLPNSIDKLDHDEFLNSLSKHDYVPQSQVSIHLYRQLKNQWSQTASQKLGAEDNISKNIQKTA